MPALQLSIQFADPQHKARLPRHRLIKWVKAALFADAQLTLRFVDAAEGRALNSSYRGKDYPTNVLTFAYAEQEEDLVSGDIILCCPIVEQEAQEQQKSLEAHYAHLIVHGVLHAQGYDHDNDVEAEEMENLERSVLQALGFDDPYHTH